MSKQSQAVTSSGVSDGDDAAASVIQSVGGVFKAIFSFVLLLVGGICLLIMTPDYGGSALGLAAIAALIAVLLPSKSLTFRKRFASAFVAVGLLVWMQHYNENSAAKEEAERALAALRESDPAAYLVQLKEVRGDVSTPK